jgi:putative membrane protein insertion efficiency factor
MDMDTQVFLLRGFLKKIFILLIEIYRKISALTPSVCRFVPTCAEYTKQAVEKYGVLKGCFLGIKRICRCHPLNKGGFDPVP